MVHNKICIFAWIYVFVDTPIYSAKREHKTIQKKQYLETAAISIGRNTKNKKDE